MPSIFLLRTYEDEEADFVKEFNIAATSHDEDEFHFYQSTITGGIGM